MTIQPINTASVALYLTPADLQERGISAEHLTAKDTLELVRQSFYLAGLPLEEPLELETYPDKCGVLVFVHLSSDRKMIWSFSDSECLLQAAAFGETCTEEALYWWDDRFWLVTNDHSVRLSEFGTMKTDDPYLSARLEEFGTLLLPHSALSVLRKHFST